MKYSEQLQLFYL